MAAAQLQKMALAIQAVEIGDMKSDEAALRFKVPRSTLQRYVEYHAFCDGYKRGLEKLKSPYDVFALTEIAITFVQDKEIRVDLWQTERPVRKLTPTQRDHLLRVVVCGNAAGDFVSPLILGSEEKSSACEQFTKENPRGSVDDYRFSDWNFTDIFENWLEHFKRNTAFSESRPVLLLVNKMYAARSDLILAAEKNHMFVVCVPSGEQTPLSKGFVKTLATYYKKAIEDWLLLNPGEKVTTDKIGFLFGIGYTIAARKQYTCPGFTEFSQCFEKYVLKSGFSATSKSRPIKNVPGKEVEFVENLAV